PSRPRAHPPTATNPGRRPDQRTRRLARPVGDAMNAANRYDVVIIGTGAGGGTLGRVLAPSGKRILFLERGTWLPREIQNWLTAHVFVQHRYISPDTWRDKDGETFQPQVHYFVGGATKMYGAALYRLRREDFGELRHHGGISPAWPFGYDDMEAYYDRAERLYVVHGARGEDPTEPPAPPYPSLSPRVPRAPPRHPLPAAPPGPAPPPSHAPCGPMPAGSAPPFSLCIRCDAFDGYPCLLHAKADAEVIAVRPALEYRNVTLITG